MEKIVLYEHLEIGPQEHNVADPKRATRKTSRLGLGT